MPADADLTAHTHSNSIMIMSPDSEGGNTLARTDGAHTPVTQIIINTLNAAVPTPTPQESAVRTDNANQRVPNNTPADHLPPACEAEGSNPKPKTRKTGTKPAKRRGKPTAASASTSFPNDANMNVTVGPSGSSTP
jgi:hypothetical protein